MTTMDKIGYVKMLLGDRGAGEQQHREGWKGSVFMGEHDVFGLGPAVGGLVGPLHGLQAHVSALSLPTCLSATVLSSNLRHLEKCKDEKEQLAEPKNKLHFKKEGQRGALGWLSWFNIQLLILAQGMISALSARAPRGSCQAWSLLGILCPSPSVPPPPQVRQASRDGSMIRLLCRQQV